MSDVKVAEAESRQAAQHSAIASKVESRVNAEVAGQAALATAPEQARIAEVASHIRSRALEETVQGERIVGRARAAARWSQFLDYAFYLVYALLGIRLVLALIAANAASGFVRFVRTVTDPFYAPFRGIVASPATDGGNTLVFPIAIALVAYVILHLALNGLLRMVGHRKTSI